MKSNNSFLHIAAIIGCLSGNAMAFEESGYGIQFNVGDRTFTVSASAPIPEIDALSTTSTYVNAPTGTADLVADIRHGEEHLRYQWEANAGKVLPPRGAAVPYVDQRLGDIRAGNPTEGELIPVDYYRLQARYVAPARCPDDGQIQIKLTVKNSIGYEVRRTTSLDCVNAVLDPPGKGKPKLDTERLKEGTIIPGEPGSHRDPEPAKRQLQAN